MEKLRRDRLGGTSKSSCVTVESITAPDSRERDAIYPRQGGGPRARVSTPVFDLVGFAELSVWQVGLLFAPA
jgi:hypothetical protein